MGDLRKKKFKGKICSPDSRHLGEKKNTRDWCGGKVNKEHQPEIRYNADPDRDWGLATQQWQICAVCNKYLSQSYQMPDVTHTFGEIVKAIRQSNGQSQQDLAAELGVPQSWVSAIENGSADSMPTVTTLQRVADALGVIVTVDFSPKKPRSFYRGAHMSTRRLK